MNFRYVERASTLTSKRNMDAKRSWNLVYLNFGSIKLGFENFEQDLEKGLEKYPN